MQYNRFSVASRRLNGSIIRLDDKPVWVGDLQYQPERQPNRDELAAQALERARQRWERFGTGGLPGTNLWYVRPEDAVRDFNDRDRHRNSIQYFRLQHNVNLLDLPGEAAVLQHVEENNAQAWEEYSRDYVRRYLRDRELGIRPPEGPVDPDDIWLNCYDIDDPNDQGTLVSHTDERINMRPVPLGMINLENTAGYAERIPVRRYSQGLTSENLRIRKLNQIDNRNIRNNNRGLRFFPALAATIRGEYPTIEEVLKRIAGGDTSVQAFGRNYAIELDHKLGLAYLWYKRNKIGYTEDATKFRLAPNYKFMREELESNGVNLYEDAA